MKKVYAGTSGWAYPKWKPGFYPAKLAPAKFLAYYATRLNSVEVNYTFRSIPSKKLLKDWIAATPVDFIFAVKASQTITHIKRLRNATVATRQLLAALQPLQDADKLGPILFQLPPNLKLDLPLLADFVEELPRDIRCTFEFRHASWFQDDVFTLLQKSNVALCLAESEEIVTPDVQTADFYYFRLRKDQYSAKARTSLAQKAKQLKSESDVFVYFKHEDSPDNALHAEALLDK